MLRLAAWNNEPLGAEQVFANRPPQARRHVEQDCLLKLLHFDAFCTSALPGYTATSRDDTVGLHNSLVQHARTAWDSANSVALPPSLLSISASCVTACMLK